MTCGKVREAARGTERKDQPANHENREDRVRMANPSDKYALSFGQQRIAFLELMHPGSALNNISLGVRLRGSLDQLRLEASVKTIITRHEMFGANFMLPEQAFIIREHRPQSAMIVHDLKHVEDAAQEEAVQRLVEEDVSRPFDLANGPLFRLTLVILSPGNQLLLITAHRLIANGWSLRLFCNELSLLYGKHDGITDAWSRPPAPQYTEYVDWQRSWLSSTSRLTQEQYWREQLRALPPPVELPTDYPRVDRTEPTRRFKRMRCHLR